MNSSFQSRARRQPASGDARVVAILGMHRSGTSWLAGSLEHAGLELGEVNTAARFNAKGNRENRFLQDLHEQVLKKNGGSWRAPNWPNRWTRKQTIELSRHISSMSQKHELWGFKDPRALLLLDRWHLLVPGLIRVGIYRHPLAVARSLRARKADFEEDEALRLWQTYNERLLAEHERGTFPVMRFDVDSATLLSHVQFIAKQLGLESPDRSHAFFDADLVHNNQTAAENVVPPAVRHVWDALEELSIGQKT